MSSGEVDSDAVSLAISDGATESSFASIWAKLLVASFASSDLPLDERFHAAIKKSSRIWRRIVDSKSLPWFATEKRKQGAFATFLGSIFRGVETGGWEAAATGDSCLAQIRGDKMLCTFPISDQSEFGSTPALVGSRVRQIPRPLKILGEWAKGDLFFLMTDAVAHWFIREAAEQTRPWELIDSLESQEAFDSWLSEVRSADHMRNDDVTILVMDVK